MMMDNKTLLGEIEIEKRLRTGTLNFRDAAISEVPLELFELTHLTKLDLSRNRLTALPSDIEKLTELKELFLADNQLADVPLALCRLRSLEVLDLGRNLLHALPPEIEYLRALEYLRIGGNPFVEFPTVISLLGSLTTLIANNLAFTELPSSICDIRSLRILNVADNEITSIPPEFTKLSNLRELHIDDKKLLSPPLEIVARGPHAIINYLHAFDKEGETFQVREAKLLIVGQGGVGKTFLMHRLVRDMVDPQNVTTEGIDITRWDVAALDGLPFRVNVWDFGGQEIYHATHQFFLTRRSLYLFVWDARKEESIINFDYWLSIIRLLSDSSPVIVVQNKIDERVKMIDEEALASKFENIFSFNKVSALTSLGISELRANIAKRIRELEHVGDVLPKAWNDIRNDLEQIQDDFISHAQYLGVCLTYGMDEERAMYLSQYYHDLGVFLHFHDNPILREIVFLKPEWATNAVYRLIDTKRIQLAFGRFAFNDLREIWSEYPRSKYLHLVELMKKFELCFQVRDTSEYIVPELLSARRPDFYWTNSDNFHFYYQYDFMPAGVLTRFIVRTQDLTKGDIYWKYGVVLSRHGTDALIVAEPLKRRIRCQIRGEDKRGMLAVIRREIEFIHRSLNNPEVVEEVPCTCPECVRSSEPYMHSFEDLRRARAKRKFAVECKASLEDVRIDEILGDIRTEDDRAVRAPLMADGTRVFVSNVVNIGRLTIRPNYSAELQRTTGLSPDDINRVVTALTSVSEYQANELRELVDEVTKQPSNENGLQRIRGFAARNGIPVIQGLSSSAVFELIRVLFT